MADWWDSIDKDLAEILIQFDLTLSGKKVFRDFRQDVKINYELLEDDLEKMPSVYSFWSSILSEQKKKTKALEMRILIRRSKIITGLNSSLKEGAKITKDDKETIINLDKEYCQLNVDLINAEATLSKLFGIVESLKMKSDNLRSLAGFKRVELQGS